MPYSVADPGSPVGGGGRQPPTRVLFGKNTCENERIGSPRSANVTIYLGQQLQLRMGFHTCNTAAKHLGSREHVRSASMLPDYFMSNVMAKSKPSISHKGI